jgi:uncharacterized protein DUF3606
LNKAELNKGLYLTSHLSLLSIDVNNDFKIKLPKDKTKINVNDFGEFIWWCNHLGTSPENLLSITNKMGVSVQEIRKYLHGK